MRTRDLVVLACNVTLIIAVIWLQWLRISDEEFARERFQAWHVSWDSQDHSAVGIHKYLLNSASMLMMAESAWEHWAHDLPPNELPKLEGQHYANPDGTTQWIYTAGQWHRIIDPTQSGE